MTSHPASTVSIFLLLAVSLASASETAVEAGDSASASSVRFISIPDPVPEEASPAKRTFLRREFLAGHELHRVGNRLAWAGLGIGAAGYFLEQPGLTGLGILGFAGGVTLSGSGTNRMVRSRNRLESSAPLETDGWTAYGIGCGLQGSGAALFAATIGFTILHKYEPSREQESLFRWSLSTFAAGPAFQGFAWHRFQRSASRAEEADRKAPFELSFVPAGEGPDGTLQPGATVSLRF